MLITIAGFCVMYMLLTQQQKSVGVLNTVGEWLLKPRRQRHSLGIAACAACCVATLKLGFGSGPHAICLGSFALLLTLLPIAIV